MVHVSLTVCASTHSAPCGDLRTMQAKRQTHLHHRWCAFPSVSASTHNMSCRDLRTMQAKRHTHLHHRRCVFPSQSVPAHTAHHAETAQLRPGSVAWHHGARWCMPHPGRHLPDKQAILQVNWCAHLCTTIFYPELHVFTRSAVGSCRRRN